MNVLGLEYTKREFIFLIIVLILVIGYFLTLYAAQLDVIEYKKFYNICKLELYNARQGYSLDKPVAINISGIIT
jgi:hypothetical protein